MIILFSAFTIISLLVINLGIIKDNNDVKSTGVVMLGITIVLCWLLIGIIANVYNTTTKLSTIEKEQNNSEIIITDSTKNSYIFDKQIDFNNITDTTTFYIEKNSNMYGFNSKYYMYYKITDRKLKSLKRKK